MGSDIQRPFCGFQTLYDTETGLVHRTFRLLGVFESNTYLIAEFRTLVLFQVLFWLIEVVLEEVEEGTIIFL